uniref:Uncharacterized protein n=1 Tax=Arundo donax TaxID=35708 RepID=A0A0A9CBL0_ARUDO
MSHGVAVLRGLDAC